jgi:predicted ribosomally synthesized peptide with SipW-like signal peptide
VNNTPQNRRLTGRKIAAVLSGGLVFGLGTLATLASWNDSDSATATFNAGVFKLQGSVDGSHFSDHVTSPGADLAFTTPFRDLHPGSVVYAPFAVRLTPDTTSAATVVISASSTEVVTGLSYQLLRSDAFGCGAATTGTTLVAASPVGDAKGAASFELATSGATSTAYLCFRVTANDSLVQSQQGTGIWQFDAVSKTG